MDPLPLVSIVTPSLNQGRFIAETIESVLGQDYPHIEYVVVDGGSSDETLAILRRYSGRLRWTSEPDHGQADAVNKGLRLTRGEILAWLNSDDMYLPGAVASAVESVRARPEVDLVYGDCNEIDETGKLVRTRRARPFDLGQLLLLEFDIYQPAVFFRRRMIEKVGLLDACLHLALDYNYWVRAGRVCRLQYVRETWAACRLHPSAKMSSRTREILAEHLATLDLVFADAALPRGLARLKRRAYSHAYLFGGVRSYENAAMEEARARLVQAFRAYPQPFRARSIKALLLLLDTVLGVKVGAWTVQRLRRLIAVR